MKVRNDRHLINASASANSSRAEPSSSWRKCRTAIGVHGGKAVRVDIQQNIRMIYTISESIDTPVIAFLKVTTSNAVL